MRKRTLPVFKWVNLPGEHLVRHATLKVTRDMRVTARTPRGARLGGNACGAGKWISQLRNNGSIHWSAGLLS